MQKGIHKILNLLIEKSERHAYDVQIIILKEYINQNG